MLNSKYKLAVYFEFLFSGWDNVNVQRQSYMQNLPLDFLSLYKTALGIGSHLHLHRTKAPQTAFPQLKEISFKMTITLGGGVSINSI